jgi:4-hydroxy-tetrahydrodipicolinate synthase
MIKGIYTALITPFNENDEVDLETYKKLIEKQIDSKVDGIVVAGTTGEGNSLTDREYYDLLETAYEYKDQLKIILSVGSNNFQKVKNNIIYANKFELNGVLLVTPYYTRSNHDGINKIYEWSANNSKNPIVIYEIPARTGISIDIEQLKELSKHKNIKAIKVANDDSSYIVQAGALASENFSVLSGNDDLFLLNLISNGGGIISAYSNVMPEYFVNTYQLFNNGKIDQAIEYYYSVLPAIRAGYTENNPILIKELVNKIVMPVGQCRLPLGSHNEEKLEAAIEEIK